MIEPPSGAVLHFWGNFMTERFNRALQLAIEAHAGQVRKGTENAVGLALPYITHPVAVATLVQRYGGTEDQVIAALPSANFMD